ncbi:MAG: WYL domain-containing protein [Synergistaceae bacterium]|nr:WYL domain-containing protein [Synergistaceae bacterium]
MVDNMHKIKLLKLYELLRTETDENHPISRINLCQRLNDMGISSNVRTLSLDIQVLRDNGYAISSFLKDKEKFYYIPEPELSLPELKILIDAVQAASFIPEEKTEKLISKIAALGGSHRAEILEKNLVRFNTRKHSNESVYYNVSLIEEAISRQKAIKFNYFHLNEHIERDYVLTPSGRRKVYSIEPVALIFHEDNYYMMGYNPHHPGKTANYRIDRMDKVEIDEDSELSSEAIEKISTVSQFTTEAFKMYGGEPEKVTLRFDRTLIGPVVDKFGESIKIKADDERNCTANVQVQVSPTFFGWLAQFGEKMAIEKPKKVAIRYLAHIESISRGE